MDLRDILGLPIESNETTITFTDAEITFESLFIQNLAEFKSILELDVDENGDELEVYRTYEGIRKIQDKELWNDITYSLVVLQSGQLNGNYFNTIGYYRSFAENGYCYPEIFQLAEGYAEFLLQQPRENHEQVKDVVVIRLQKYDILVVPPSYGVTIINPSDKKTIISRIRASDAEEIKEPFHNTKGGCYSRFAERKWDYNPNYDEIPNLRLGEPQNKWKSLKRGTPIYSSYAYNPRYFKTLIEPDPSLFIL
ncbi:MAG: glucose-6-phosphate isomerase family protein [Candidatus Heimdallarchaeaceae archaeon]